MYSNLPNIISLLRVAVTPFLCLAILDGNNFRAIWLLVFGSATDFFDGYFARKLEVHTGLGIYLDPLADKIFLLSIFVALAIKLDVPTWFVGFMMFREIIIVAGGGFIKKIKNGVVLKPTIWGKLNTCFLILFIFLNLIYSHFSLISGTKLDAVLIFVTFFSFFSLMHYIKIGIKLVRS